MSDDQLDEILDVLVAYARQDFSPRLRVSDRRDVIDAIATGINLLAEELDGEVASRRELESAYARLQEAQAQLVIAEKFAAVGQLASGVAHELNNPATWVSLGLSAMERHLARARALAAEQPALLGELDAMQRSLADTIAGVDRMRRVLADLRTLSRTDRDVLAPVDLPELVRSTCHLARPSYQQVAELVFDLEPVPAVLGDRGRLGQLITNLVVNAAHAVADRQGPQTIVVSTRTSGDRVILAVEDSGPGIPYELHERVFDPYFTTKPSDVGSGLGLAIVRDIATRHEGTARIARGAAGGARVEIALPATEATIGIPAVAPSPVVPSAAARARVLLIDDEEMLLRSLQQAVDEEHDVVTAIGGRAALAILEHDRRFDLVICDLQMPHVDGVAVHEALTGHAPELAERFVVMSGGAVTPRAASFLQRTRPRSLRKPIELDELLALARAAI